MQTITTQPDLISALKKHNGKTILSLIKDYGNAATQIQMLHRYIDFLKQPLQLGFFVPCDEDGNVLCEPDEYQEFLKIGQQGIMCWGYNIYNQCLNFHKAKERVLFKGFEWDFENETIETFGGIENQIELAETAIKQIGL